MKVLREYMREHGLMPVDLAQAIGVYPQTVYYWLNGQRKPGRRNIEKIVAWSDGNITTEDLVKN